jgi:SPP1 gp7 family putative phage head morphogenesis protein
MPSINRTIQSLLINHAVNARGYSANVLRRMIATLNRSDDAIFRELNRRLQYMDPDSFTIQRLDGMLDSVRQMNTAAYAEFDSGLRSSLRELSIFEVAFQTDMLARVSGFAFPVAKVVPEQVYAASLARPFQGALLREWIAGQAEDKAQRIRRTIADGFVQNKTTDQIVRDIRGTQAKGFSDGVIEISRRDATAVVRTALSHTAAFAQQEVYDANDDLIKGYTWGATLDTRTTPQCQVRDGKEYNKQFKPVGHSYPWGAGPGLLHWNCRSVRIPIIKSWRDLGIPIDEIEPSTRASMDGQVPAKTDYEEWLKDQSAERQDEVLGPTRAALFRDGNLSLADLYSANGEELTIEELRKKSAEAFKRAGL